MKTAIIGLLILITVLLGIIAVGSIELNDLVRLKQSEIKGLKKEIELKDKAFSKSLDSIRRASAIREDSILLAHMESQKANAETQRLIKKYEKIIFVRFSNDAQRDSVLSKLYPSFHPIR